MSLLLPPSFDMKKLALKPGKKGAKRRKKVSEDKPLVAEDNFEIDLDDSRDQGGLPSGPYRKAIGTATLQEELLDTFPPSLSRHRPPCYTPLYTPLVSPGNVGSLLWCSGFQQLFHASDYAIDPTDPKFKRTATAEHMLSEISRRHAEPSRDSNRASKGRADPVSDADASLARLVSSVKRKAKKVPSAGGHATASSKPSKR